MFMRSIVIAEAMIVGERCVVGKCYTDTQRIIIVYG